MKSVAVAAMLCYIMAMGMALPSKVAVSEERTAETQWHLQAPSHGCVEVAHSVGGTVFRSYACDDVNGEFSMSPPFRVKNGCHNIYCNMLGPCVFSPAVDTCPTSALFHKPNLERVVNIRSKDHLFRYYNQIGICVILVAQ